MPIEAVKDGCSSAQFAKPNFDTSIWSPSEEEKSVIVLVPSPLENTKVSTPSPPDNLSTPEVPLIVSSPAPAKIMSFPVVPVRVSPAVVPTSVTDCVKLPPKTTKLQPKTQDA